MPAVLYYSGNAYILVNSMNIKNILWILPIAKTVWKWISKLWTPPEKTSNPLKELYCLDDSQYCYSKEEVEILRIECKRIGASAPSSFWTAPTEALMMCFNGVGPYCWSTRRLKLISSILEDCMVMALAHDYEFTFSPRTYLHFIVANLRLIVNGVLEACSRNNIKLIWYGIILAILSQLFGWRIYRDFDVAAFKRKVEECINSDACSCSCAASAAGDAQSQKQLPLH